MLVPVAIVAAIVVQLGTSLFGLKKSVGLTPTEVRGYLENFLDGSSGA